ncbi:TPA: type-F conjugative transfer system pilin acetylase TraX [Escherichia coli]|nr:type-F conjugative transfer system pilin acetylase TraX [Escherichia coli]
MMSIAQVRSAGSAGNYYTDKDNYYVLGSMGERWAGRGAEQLGLQGSVDKDVFTRLLEGRLPDGADLSRMQDGSNRHRPGYDLTFSAPKSVSMMAMLGGDKRLIDAHNQAVDFAVRQVEALASTRVMTDGQSETVLTGNLVMALFNHDTSRDQEPQLHTHAVVANVTQHNGEWKTLSSDKVGKTGFIENVYANQIAFGRLYREKLKEQVEALGYETEVVGKHGTGRQTLMTTDNTNTTRNDSLVARTDTWLQSLLVWSPGQRDIIKTVALVLMVLDHANRILHLDQSWMFLAGRGAFPLFALVWGLNLSRHAHIRQLAINRLWGWAVFSQFWYYFAGFPWYEGNILFAFAVAAQVLTWCETRSGWRTAAAILMMALWGPLSGTSYGIAGLLMLAVSHRLYRAEDRMERLVLVACLLAVIPALNLATSDAAAVAGLVMTVLTVGLVSCAGKSLPRFWPGDFFPTFYACHLAVLGVLAL